MRLCRRYALGRCKGGYQPSLAATNLSLFAGTIAVSGSPSFSFSRHTEFPLDTCRRGTYRARCDERFGNYRPFAVRSGRRGVRRFFSPGYPQVTQAVFQFLATRPGRLALVLCEFNKGYLCRPKAARGFLEYVRTSLYADMVERGCGKVTI